MLRTKALGAFDKFLILLFAQGQTLHELLGALQNSIYGLGKATGLRAEALFLSRLVNYLAIGIFKAAQTIAQLELRRIQRRNEAL